MKMSKQTVGLFLGPALFFLIFLLSPAQGLSREGQNMGAVAILMATWWLTEAVPIPVTSLLPLVLYPVLNILPSSSVAPNYTNHLIFLFIGGFLMATTIQKWNLHKRIALSIILIVGTNPYLILLGFMIATAFLAMWISNTATAMMILPIAMAVVIQLSQKASYKGEQGPVAQEMTLKSFGSVLMLGVAYSASIGGVGTLIGTPPNIVFAGFVKELFPAAPEIGFLQWMKVGVPIVIIFLPISWLVLAKFASPISLKDFQFGDGKSSREIIKKELNNLGPMSYQESMVALIFVLTVLLWVFRAPINLGTVKIPGWSQLFPTSQANFFHDATVAMFTGLLPFFIPSNWKKREFLLDWETAVKGIPWGTVFLFGGGFAMASGFTETGLGEWMGNGLAGFQGFSALALILIVTIFSKCLTEVISNTATATMLMPILGATALAMQIHPFFLMIPATLSASFAFMLPVATPPNAIVFGSGWITMGQMAKTGLILNILAVIVLTLLSYLSLIYLMGLDLGVMPDWARV